MAADDLGGDDPPLALHRLRACVAPGHEPRRPSLGRSCRGAGCGGRWRASWSQHLTVARVAEGLGVSWNTANDAVLAEGTTGA